MSEEVIVCSYQIMLFRGSYIINSDDFINRDYIINCDYIIK